MAVARDALPICHAAAPSELAATRCRPPCDAVHTGRTESAQTILLDSRREQAHAQERAVHAVARVAPRGPGPRVRPTAGACARAQLAEEERAHLRRLFGQA